jgi:hypothetical protein
LEGIFPQNSLVGGYLLINSVLEETGKLVWTWVSCAYDRPTQLCAVRYPTLLSDPDRRALNKSESFDSWGYTVLFKLIPTVVSLIFISPGFFFIPFFALATVLALRIVTVLLGFRTLVHASEWKDNRNDKRYVLRLDTLGADSDYWKKMSRLGWGQVWPRKSRTRPGVKVLGAERSQAVRNCLVAGTRQRQPSKVLGIGHKCIVKFEGRSNTHICAGEKGLEF